MLSFKTNMRYSKECAKNKRVRFNEIIWLIILKMRVKMKNRSKRYDINSTTPWHGYKYTKYKMCPSRLMIMGNKQHLSTIWNWIHGKVKQHWGWVERVIYKKMRIHYFHLEELGDQSQPNIVAQSEVSNVWTPNFWLRCGTTNNEHRCFLFHNTLSL